MKALLVLFTEPGMSLHWESLHHHGLGSGGKGLHRGKQEAGGGQPAAQD